MMDLDELLARGAIHDVLTRYFIGLDTRRPDLIGSCFSEDIEAVYEGVHVASGHAALMDFFSGKKRGDFVTDLVDLQRSTHAIGNVSYDIQGDRALTETGCLAHLIDLPGGKLRMRTRGLRYRDELRRTGERWLICRREHILDWSRDDDVKICNPV